MNAPINILVVDDVAQNLTAVEAVLADLELGDSASPAIRVLTATCGAAALELLQQHDVALALVDVQMPGMDGFQLAEHMRASERSRTIPLIFLTAEPRWHELSFRGYEAGAVDFLCKPFDAHVLASKVKVFVQLQQQKLQLSQQLDELQRAMHLNQLFTAVLGHDLRTPLSVVMNGAMLLPMMTDHPKVAVTAQRMQSSARRMAHMVDQLLDLARIRSGAMQPQLVDMDYAPLCRILVGEVTGAQDGDASAARIVVEASGDTCGAGDSAMLAQTLNKLLTHALAYVEPTAHTTPNAAALRLHVDGSQPSDILLHIASPCVLPPARLAILLEEGRYVRQSGAPSHSMELDLCLARLLVAAHGGDITARSGEHEGTVLTIRLPRHPAPATRSAALAAPLQEARS